MSLAFGERWACFQIVSNTLIYRKQEYRLLMYISAIVWLLLWLSVIRIRWTLSICQSIKSFIWYFATIAFDAEQLLKQINKSIDKLSSEQSKDEEKQ